MTSDLGTTRRLLSAAILLLATAATGFAATAGTAGRGELCLAPFHARAPLPGSPPQPVPPGEARLSDTTWEPQYDSHFTFFVDGRLRATLGNGEMAHLTGLPVAKPIRVRVRLDDRPFESFALDLAKATDHRICLWLYPGYWHWIDHGWDAKLGCKCGEKPAPAP